MRWFFVRTRFLPSIWETFPFAPSYHHSIQQLSLQLQPFSRVEKRKKNVLPFAVIFGVLFFIRKVILMMEVTIIAIIFIRSEQFCTIFFFSPQLKSPEQINQTTQNTIKYEISDENRKQNAHRHACYRTQIKSHGLFIVFFSFFFLLLVQRTLLFNTYMCSNHDMLHAQFRTDLHFRTLDLILNFFFILRYVFYSPSYHIIFFSEVCFFSIRPKKNTHTLKTQKNARLYVTVNKLGIENSII